MLQYFAVSRDYNKLRVRLFVDLEHKDAEISVMYAGRLKRSQTIRFDEVSTPEKAEAYLSRQAGIHGSLVETLEHQYRSEAA